MIISGVLKNMRHAYLIIAHKDFDILKLLIHSLDDVRNDIYVHIDKKIKHIPDLMTEKSTIYVLQDRVDVRWGNYSQIQCEFALWEFAMKKGPYAFYHLISGTHLPLKSQDEIHAFYTGQSGKIIFSNLVKREGDYQEMLKMHRINICTMSYASSNLVVSRTCQFLWKSFIAVQRWIKYTVNNGIQFYWANNWCSLSHSAVEYLVSNKKRIICRYRWSFCGDEWFAPTELLNSSLSVEVVNDNRLLYGQIGKSRSEFITQENYKDAISSDCFFARKFSSNDISVAKTVINSYDKIIS